MCRLCWGAMRRIGPSLSRAAALLAIASTAIGAGTVRADEPAIVITVGFVEVSEMVTPNVRHLEQLRQDIIRLHGEKTIDIVRIKDGVREYASTMTLGVPIEKTDAFTGIKTTETARIIDGKIIVESVFPTYTRTRTVRLVGKSACTASMSYVLHPGQQRFEVNDPKTRVHYEFAALSAPNPSCSISKIY